MPIKIQAPDNSIIEFPDGTSDDEIMQVMQREYPTPVEEQQPIDEPENNVGMFSYLADIRDRSKAITDAVDVFNDLREIDDNDPRRQELISKFEEANKRIEFYSQEDNWLLGLGKSIAADVALTLGGAAAGGALGGPIGGAAGAGVTGFTLGREQNKIFNAYRELQETGDLTSEELKGAVDTAIVQAGLEGAVDAFTGGVGSKLAKGVLKKVAIDSSLGATTEVGNAMLQRGYVSNLEVFGPGALEEYLGAAAEGAVAQAILSGTFRAMERPNETPNKDPINETEVVEAQQTGFLEKVSEDFKTADELRSKLQQYNENPDLFRLDKAKHELDELNKKQFKQLDDGSMERVELDDETLAKRTDLEQKIAKYTPAPEKQDAAGTADLFETPDTTIETKTVVKKELKTRVIENPQTNEKDIGEYRLVKEEGKRDQEVFERQGTLKINKNSVEISNLETGNKDALDNVVGEADRLHTKEFGSKKGVKPRLISKNKMSNKEYISWSDFKKNFSNEYRIDTLNVDKVKVAENGDISSLTGEPLFTIKQIPPALKKTRERITREHNIVPNKSKPTVERDGFFRKDQNAQQIEDTLLSAFGDNPNTKFTITGMSNKSLREFASSPEYKAFQTLAKKRKSIEIVRAADEMTSEIADAITSKVNHTAIPDTTFSNKVAKHAQELLEPMKPLIQSTAGIETISKTFGSKPPRPETAKALNSIWPKWLTPPMTLANKSPEHAELLNLGRLIQNTKDMMNISMRFRIKSLQKSMKKRGTWKPAHDYLERLNYYSGRLVDNVYVYIDESGKVNKVPEHLTKDIMALDNYYKTSTIFSRAVKEGQFKNAMKENDVELAQLIKNDIDQMDRLLSEPYFPRRRFGDLRFSIDGAMYAMESILGVDKLAPNANEQIAENLYVSKKEWEQFRQLVKQKHGKDIGPSAKKYYTEQLQGDVPDNTLFRVNMKNLKAGKYERFLENEMISRLLNEADKNKLEYFKRKAAGDGALKRLVQKSEKIPGWSDDYDRIAHDHYKTRSSGWVNYLFEPALMKMHEKYLKNDKPQNSAEEYAHQIFGEPTEDFTQGLSRFQAFMALAFSPSTAALQWTSMVTTVPLVLSTAIGGPATSRALLSPKGFNLFRMRLNDPDLLGNYEAIKKATDAQFAEFVARNPRTFSNTVKNEFESQRENNQRVLGKALDKVEDLGHGMMLKVEEATRLQSAYAIHSALRNPKNLAQAKKAFANDARYQDMIRTRGDIPEADIITELLIDNAFGIYGKLGWANFQKHNLARVALPFISYPLQITHVLADHIKGERGAAGQVAAASMMMSMPLMFGLAGAPFFEWFEMAYDAINGIFKRGNRSLENDIFDAVYDINPDVARYLKKGFTGTAFGVDISKRVALGNPFSGITGAFTSNAPLGRDIGYLMPKASEMTKALRDGDTVSFIEAASPIALQNAIKSLVEYTELLGQPGGALTKSGEVIVPDDQIQADEVIKKLMGFQPMSVAMANNSYYGALEEQSRYTGPKKRLTRSAYPYYKRWIESGKTDETARLRVVELAQEYGDIHRQNGDPYTKDKADGFAETLLKMYNNERGFTGGEPKSNIPEDVKRRALDRYERMSG